MSTAAVVRRMTDADLAALLPLAASLSHVPRWTQSAWVDAIRPPHLAFVAEDGDAIAGFAITAVTADIAELQTLAVVPARRRQGIARQLLAATLEKLRSAAVPELWLEVRVFNEPAIRLYRGLGFEETGRRPRYYTSPVEDALLMRLLIAPSPSA